MAFSHARIAINNVTPTKVTPDEWFNLGTTTNCTIQIQNLGADAVYVGTKDITSISYGCSLATGATLTVDDLPPQDAIYVLSSSSSGYVGVLSITR